MTSLRLRQGVCKLVLTRFRSYESLLLPCTTQPVVLTGANGAGKTNILEALSLLSPGRGCRQVKLEDIQQISEFPEDPWAVSAILESQDATYKVGTSGSKSALGRDTRRVYLNGEENVSQSRLTEIVNVLWITPSMDRLFLEGASARRKFLDRLVYSFDTQHATRMNRFEARMRERNKLLTENTVHHPWLTALEKQMADDAFSITLARERTVFFIQKICNDGLGPFPSPYLKVIGALEDIFIEEAEVFIDCYRQLLEQERFQDQATGRTRVGPHASDLGVFYEQKNIHAKKCSTGEQKALLISIVLAVARLKAKDQETITLILLDEIVAHLDEERRRALLSEIISLPLQAWMTGTDSNFFNEIKEDVQHFNVENSCLTPINR